MPRLERDGDLVYVYIRIHSDGSVDYSRNFKGELFS